MLTILELALKGGFRTSEFWLSVLALLVTAGGPAIQAKIDALHGAAATGHGTTALLYGVGAAVIAGAYSLARALTKTKVAAAAATIESAPDAPPTPPPNAVAIHLPSGNTMTPGPGTTELESSHREAVLAATAALKQATEALTQASNLPRPATFGASQAAPVGSSSSSSGASPGV